MAEISQEISRVGVVGCGIMGSGIAESCARAGCSVVVREPEDKLLEAGAARIIASLARAVRGGKLDEAEREAAFARIAFTTELGELGESDLVIEAVSEQVGLKTELFAALDATVPEHAVLASNTSSIPIARLGAATGRPASVIGMHFFNPVPVLGLVELIPSILTSDETLARAESFATERLGKKVVHSKDRAGFIVNGLLIPYLLDAVRLLESGVATAEDIDAGMELGCAHPMGPLRLADFIGLDTVVLIAESMLAEYTDVRLATPSLLRRMVEAGLLGRKSGRGFYDYPVSGSERT